MQISFVSLTFFKKLAHFNLFIYDFRIKMQSNDIIETTERSINQFEELISKRVTEYNNLKEFLNTVLQSNEAETTNSKDVKIEPSDNVESMKQEPFEMLQALMLQCPMGDDVEFFYKYDKNNNKF